MASIRKRGDLQWEARIRRRGLPTIRKTFERKHDAELWAKEQETGMGYGRFIDRRPAERTTLKEALQRYLDEEVPKKKGHQLRYLVNAWMTDDLALRPLASIRGSDLAGWRDRRLKTIKRYDTVLNPKTKLVESIPVLIKPKTVMHDLSIISHLFAVARTEWGMEGLLNPVAEITKPKPSEPRSRRLEIDEERRLLRACADDKKAPWLWSLVVVGAEMSVATIAAHMRSSALLLVMVPRLSAAVAIRSGVCRRRSLQRLSLNRERRSLFFGVSPCSFGVILLKFSAWRCDSSTPMPT
jgi:hypothetical protein